MAPAAKTFPAPTIPDTPSKAINDMLQAKCGKTFDNPFKYGAALFVCYAFTAIAKIYQMLHHDLRPSHTKWMASCAIFGVAAIIGATLSYYVMLSASILLDFVTYYACIVLALAGVGLGVAGAIFFDKSGAAQSPGFEPETKGSTQNKAD